MQNIFVDALHYIAVLLPDDDLHDRALRTANALTEVSFVTSDPVLVEVLAYVCERGDHARLQAVRLVELLRSDKRTTIIPQTRQLFDRGIALYAGRLDKGYSLTDCMSMVICAERRLSSVLTHDRHFTQEGYEILL